MNIVRNLLIASYIITLSIVSFDFISGLTHRAAFDNTCSGWDCLGNLFVPAAESFNFTLPAIIIIFQIPILIGLILKKEWLREHASFTFISLLILFLSVLYSAVISLTFFFS